jgi:hypothetical protein
MYIRPFTTSRMITVRLSPPRLPGGIKHSTRFHSSSVRSLGYGCPTVDNQRPVLDDKNALRENAASAIGDLQPTTIDPGLERRIYAAYYNESSTHRSLNKDAPFHRAIERLGAITSHPILGGLHHQYCRI